jgi:hypothetical protein
MMSVGQGGFVEAQEEGFHSFLLFGRQNTGICSFLHVDIAVWR